MFPWSTSARDLYCRETRSSDAAALADLHREGFERPWGSAEFAAMLSEKHIIGHIAEAALSRPRGFILSRLAADEAEVLSIVVSRKARRQGIAAKLLGLNMAALAQAGAKALFLEVEEGNAAAIALYRQFGFAEVGKRKSYYKRTDGSNPAALIMRRGLT